MKALAASCALLVALLSVAKPVEAVPVYMDTLAAGEAYQMNIDNSAVTTKKTIVTIYHLSGGRPATAEQEAKLGKGNKFEILTLAPGARPSFFREIPKGTRLLAIELVIPRGGRVPVEIVQGNNSFPEVCDGGCTLVFDVE